jgi:hypothetical protein
MRYRPRYAEYGTHDLVDGVRGGAEHEWAAAVDDRDAVLAAVRRRRVGDAAPTEGTVHPDLVDTQLHALAQGLFGMLRPSTDDDGLDTSRNRLEVGIARLPVDMRGIRSSLLRGNASGPEGLQAELVIDARAIDGGGEQ